MTITIITQEGNYSRNISVDAAGQSKLLMEMIGEGKTHEELLRIFGDPNPSSDGEIPVKASPRILDYVIDFMEHQAKNHPWGKAFILPRVTSSDLEEYVKDKYEVEFVDLFNKGENNFTLLLEYLALANYLEVDSLRNLCLIKIAVEASGKTKYQLCELFYTNPNDLTPEVEQRVLDENPWIDTL